MLKKSVYIIGLFSLLAMVACSSGTVDPNANPLAYADESSSSIVVQSISSSSMRELSISSSSINSSSSNVQKQTSFIIMDSLYVVEKNDYGCAISFDSEVTITYIVSGNSPKSGEGISENNGFVAVYEKEKGATATYEKDGKKYLAKFKYGQDKRIEKSMEIKNYGSACDSLFKSFEESCNLVKSNIEPAAACDKDGSVEVYCSYVDENADFDTLLDEFTSEVEKNCGEGLCQINKTN